jgi:CubicO group peptidase (beta-lactamase class C family)
MPADEPARAPRVPAADLRELCRQVIDDLDIAGAQVAVAADDTLVHAEAGVANVELGTPVTADTLFQIGSTTKVYTAALVMQLVDQGLVDIDRPVADHLPDVRLAPGDEWRVITPRHLMSMTSGLDNGPYTDTGRDDDCVARYIDLLAEIPLTFPPGSAYGYSNASTNVSGLLIEALTGQCWDEALRDRLLVPAGLTESVSLFEQLPYHQVAVGRLPGKESAERPWVFSRGCGPAGATLATSARDLVRFGRLFLRRGRTAGGTALLSEAAVETMVSPQVEVTARILADSWCVGPYRKVWGDVEVFGHSGTTQNGSSTLLWIPRYELAIATVVNTPPRGYPFADAVFDTVLRDWLGVPKPPRPEPISGADGAPGRARGGAAPAGTSNGAGAAGAHLDLEPYVGRYDAYGVSYVVTRRGEELALTRHRPRNLVTDAAEPPLDTLLRPIAPHRFLPDDDAVTDHHTWDIAFSVGDEGHATLLHNGAFAARRTG